RIRPSELSLDNKSKLKCPSLLCHFHKSEEGPAIKQREGPRGVPEKSTKKTRSRGVIRQTKAPLESKTREQPSLKRASNPSSRCETKGTSLRVKRSETRTAPSPRTFPLPLSPNTMYSFERIGVRLENHLSFPVM